MTITGLHRRTHEDRTTAETAQRGPSWYFPALLALLACTAILYLWDLSASGDANSFYAAAVQAGTKSWKAFFFGSLDTSNFITVDKPPAFLWVMELSGRIFGFSSWSMLVPQALEGVGAVALLTATVRRAMRSTAGDTAAAAGALIAGAVLALTPAAVLIFRFNNPDALLVLLMVAAAYFVTRAIEDGRTRWLIGAGVAAGVGFITKDGEALLSVPVFGLVYLIAGPASVRRRVWQLLLAFAALVVSAGWWIAAVLLTPAADRPYVGGSTDNNPLQLAFGYNGFGRLLGSSAGAGGGGAGSGFGGASGLQRLFSGEFGLEISWLLPAALILGAAGLWVTWHRTRTNPARAGLLLWGGWLAVTGMTFAYMQGTIHPYYTVLLAPAIGALTGTGGVLLWQRRDRAAYAVLAVIVLVTAGWGFHLLRSDPSYHPWVADIAIAIAAAAVLILGAAAIWSRTARRLAATAAAVCCLAIALPASAWALGTAATPHTGSIPTAVAGSGSTGSGLGEGGSGRPSGKAGFDTGRDGAVSRGDGAVSRGAVSGGAQQGGTSVSGTDAALIKALEATTTRWAAAVEGSQSAASLELATGGKAIMAMGGFTGIDPAPTLAEFEAWVKAGDITYFIAGGGQGGGGQGGGGQVGGGQGESGSSSIATWVEAHFKSVAIGGETVYVLHS